VRRVTLILCGAAAAIWIVSCAVDLLDDGRVDGLKVAAAISWIAAFFVTLKRYRNDRE